MASVVEVGPADFAIDAGLIAGLRPGDTGRVFYELKVGDEIKRLEVGGAEVLAVGELGARMRLDGEGQVRPGYRVELELPAERVRAAELLRLARSRLEADQFDEIARRFLEDLVPDDAALEERFIAWLEERRRQREAAAERPAGQGEAPAAGVEPASPQPVEPAAGQPPEPAFEEPVAEEPAAVERAPEDLAVEEPAAEEPAAAPPPAPAPPPGTLAPPESRPAPPPPVARPPAKPMAAVAAGAYWIGPGPDGLQYYDQQPRFQIRLDGFRIDRQPVSQSELAASHPDFAFERQAAGLPATGVPFALAASHCRSRGLRLPTEFEVEVAAAEIAEPGATLLEWTASWYQPYPGNQHPEEAYGERYRVLRAVRAAGDPERFRRRFMAPVAAHPRVGFRCAGSSPSPS